jgi:hypothetical protein
MLQKISTDAGECWAVIFHNTSSLEDIQNIQKSLIDLMSVATQSDTFDSAKNSYYWVLSLLDNMLLSDDQMFEYERLLKEKV